MAAAVSAVQLTSEALAVTLAADQMPSCSEYDSPGSAVPLRLVEGPASAQACQLILG